MTLLRVPPAWYVAHMQIGSIPPPIHFSLADFVDEERHAALLGQYDKCSLNAEAEPLVQLPRASGSIYRLPGVVVSKSISTPTRTRLLADPSKADDDLAFALMECRGRVEIDHCGSEYELGYGQAALHRCDEKLVTTNYGIVRSLCIKIPRASLLPLLGNREEVINHPIDPASPALWMLRSYIPTAIHPTTLSNAATARLAADHLRDLVVLALGHRGDGAEAAREGGLKAARLAAIKAWIEANLAEPELTLDHAEVLFGISRRTIQNLFEEDGTSFTVYVRDRRLQRARQWLAAPERGHMSISEIAYDVGFGDLSYFNRSFRKRFGMTPGDVRRGSLLLH